MVKNVTYHNPIHAEENTPLVTILETRVATQEATAIDSRNASYVIDLTKASFGGIFYPKPGTQWYLKKISGVWALMARAPQQNPQLSPLITPLPGDTVIGSEGKTIINSPVTVLSPPINAVTATGSADAFESRVTGNAVPRAAIRGDGSLWFSDGTSAADTTLYRSAADTLQTDDAIRSNRTNVGDGAFASKISTDTTNRLFVSADGTLQWGPGGAAALDTSWARTGAGYIVTNATVQSTKATTGNVAFAANVTGDTQSRLNVFSGGVIQWGDGTNSQDTNLYRTTADHLKTDDMFSSFRVGARLRRVANQLGTTGVTAVVSWDTSDSQTGGTWITVPGTTITVPSGRDGVYAISVYILWASGGGARNFTTLNISSGLIGTVAFRSSMSSTEGFTSTHGTVPLFQGDTMTVDCFQNSGGNVNFTAGIYITRVSGL